ncbi:hypothetical protein JCM10207_003277 [Rhodosporidiobolus poonsookiae]
MEVDFQRLEGNAGVTNEVLVHLLPPDGLRLTLPPGAALPKKAARRPTTLPVFNLHLTFSPTSHGDVFAKALPSVPEAQAPTPLAPVVLSTLRDSTKVPHRPYLRHASTNAALVELAPLEPARTKRHRARAPRTADGVPVTPAEAGKAMQVNKQPEKSHEDRAARLRRNPQGNGRAVTPPPPQQEEPHGGAAYIGPEDD